MLTPAATLGHSFEVRKYDLQSIWGQSEWTVIALLLVRAGDDVDGILLRITLVRILCALFPGERERGDGYIVASGARIAAAPVR